MRFALVILETPLSKLAVQTDRARHRANIETWMRQQAAAGVLVGGEAFETELTPPATVRREPNGTVYVTDEPFAGPRETLGGYIVVQAPNRESAIEIAKSWPASGEHIEVRPICEAAVS